MRGAGEATDKAGMLVSNTQGRQDIATKTVHEFLMLRFGSASGGRPDEPGCASRKTGNRGTPLPGRPVRGSRNGAAE